MKPGNAARRPAPGAISDAPTGTDAEPRVIRASLESVTRYHGRQAVLRDLSLRLHSAEVVALVGLNGAGKTTLLRTLLGQLRPHRGRALLNGLPADEPASRCDVIYLPERFAPDGAVPVQRWLAHLMRLCGAAHDREALRRECARFDIDPALLEKKPVAMSKGETQKIGLAVSFLSGKPFLVLDEPMSGLDPRARVRFRDRILHLREEQPEVTILFTSHLLADAAALGDRVLIIHQGALRFDGSVPQCRRRYACDDLEQAFLRCIAQ